MSKPAGFHTLTPYIVVEDAAAAIELYPRALGAEVLDVAKAPDGKIMNAQLRIGDSMLMLNDEFPEYGALGPKKVGGSSVTIHMYVDDVDAAFAKAVEAGFTVEMPLSDQFWGDRYGSLLDPFGHQWGLAQVIEEVSSEERQNRINAMGTEPSV